MKSLRTPDTDINNQFEQQNNQSTETDVTQSE